MILKLQQGGNSLPPFVSYTPVTVTGPATAPLPKSNPTSLEDVDLTDKDLLKMLDKLEGLPSDMNSIVSQLQTFYIDKQYNTSASTSTLASRYLSVLQLMKYANFNRKEYDDAYETVSKNGGINEVAINERGQLLCVNKDKDFKLMTVDELKSNKEYSPLTNSELLYYRALDPTLAYNNSLLKIVKNGIGVEYITDIINKLVEKLGVTEQQTQGYASKENGIIINGINLLKLAALKGVVDLGISNLTVDGLYKNSLLTKDQTVQVKQALSSIYKLLPENARTLLKIKSNGTTEGSINLLSNLIASKENISVKFETDLQLNTHPDGTKISDKEILDKSKINPAVAFLMDMGAETLLPINAGNNESLVLQAYRMPVTTKEGNPLGVSTLDKVANTSALGGIFDFSHVTMGDQVLDMSALSNIVVDGSSIFKVYLPYDQTKAAQGVITPNLNYLILLLKVRLEVKDSNALTPEEINAIYTKYNLPEFIDLEGNVNEAFYKPFGVMNGTALSDAFNTDVSLDTFNFEEITDENIILNNWNILKGENSKENFDSKGFLNYLGLGDYLQMFKGLVYLPLNSTDPTLGAYSGGDQPSLTTIQDNKTRWQQNLRVLAYKPQGQLQL